MNNAYMGNEDLAYMAGYIDADGCMHLTNVGRHNKPVVSISSTHMEILLFIKDLLYRHGVTAKVYTLKEKRENQSANHSLIITKREDLQMFCLIMKPYIVLKARQLSTMAKFIALSSSDREKRDECYEMMKMLNRKGL